eukprot:scaffold79_cov259-Pinguiococcus_pyrenoidosus.AAC.4
MATNKARTALDESSKDGAFQRVDAVHRNVIEPGSDTYPPEKDRYHLYISYACPWANRCLATMYLKGLEDIIGLSIVHPTWQVITWAREDRQAGVKHVAGGAGRP